MPRRERISAFPPGIIPDEIRVMEVRPIPSTTANQPLIKPATAVIRAMVIYELIRPGLEDMGIKIGD
ncbi:MAG TPA: hypothetical protein DIT99_06305 [Candidatus Latescibacteria bacterium]|jgi:hypothetical protein|nr:hypothetical protein [Candidatus Latescibacterota bacterium]